MTESLARTRAEAPFDIDDWEAINQGTHGQYFYVDRRSGTVYASDHSLLELREYRERLRKEKGLGLAPLVIPLITAVGTVGGGVFSFLSNKKGAEGAEAQAQAHMQVAQLQAQQKAQQTAMIQQLATYGLIAAGGIAVLMILK